MPELTHGAWLGHCATLFFLTLAHEDAAILAAAYARLEFGLPRGLAFLSVYSGVVAGDLCIYGLGRAAQRCPWLRARIIGPRVDQARTWLEGHLIRTVALCRITPGLLFPSFVACGWFRLPFWRFALVSLVSATVYTPLAMAVATLLGEKVLHRLGRWAWALVMLLILALMLRNARRPIWPWAIVTASEHPQPLAAQSPNRNRDGNRDPNGGSGPTQHRGMPTLERPSRRVARAERVPVLLFYLPVVLHWLALALRFRGLTLPTVANPMIETGGFWGESKSGCLDQVAEPQRCWLAPYVSLTRQSGGAAADLARALRLMDEGGLGFPVVAKPDIGWQGYGVRLLNDVDQLSHYLADFPADARLLLQRPVPYDGEAGVFYVRRPGEPEGHVYSLTLRYFPHVVGDGRSSVRQLVLRDRCAGWKARYHLGARPEHLGLDPAALERVPAPGEPGLYRQHPGRRPLPGPAPPHYPCPVAAFRRHRPEYAGVLFRALRRPLRIPGAAAGG